MKNSQRGWWLDVQWQRVPENGKCMPVLCIAGPPPPILLLLLLGLLLPLSLLLFTVNKQMLICYRVGWAGCCCWAEWSPETVSTHHHHHHHHHHHLSAAADAGDWETWADWPLTVMCSLHPPRPLNTHKTTLPASKLTLTNTSKTISRRFYHSSSSSSSRTYRLTWHKLQ